MEHEFKPPPEAPVFEPSEEEFKNPLAYIAKIRPIAEKAGICKIKPPSDWQPPFAVDVDNFKFTPRIQRLNELEATTRTKLNFLDQVAKFWELQGSSLKIPSVERKLMDLYLLHKIVQQEGGMHIVTKERKWAKVAARMKYQPGKSIGSLLRQHYERILYPYELFKSGNGLGETSFQDLEVKDTDCVLHGISSHQATESAEEVARRSKRCTSGITSSPEKAADVDYSTNSELKKLQFYGAGPKMSGYSPVRGTQHELSTNVVSQYKIGKSKGKINPLRLSLSCIMSQIDLIVCHICGRGDDEAKMLLCDGCDDSYHSFCLIPPMYEIPKGDWKCPQCVAQEVERPQEAFGFEQAKRDYTLQEFGEMADQFKSDYFNMPAHLVPTSVVEKEFWRLVKAVNEDVCVEYGADIHTLEHGSGFPTKTSKCFSSDEEEYVTSGWNLNNLPVLEDSVLRHINADINGMKIPWVYVGMCFATFCWHNEDHWSYSINYLHWGEPKTWYGVPGEEAEVFEEAMRDAAPELFETQPDLLHQLVTILNPNILMAAGVHIYRMDQYAGEFVLTFPRAYHAGFNQGYNFAEAVNFCPADWLPVGRACISHYGLLHRFCVFSHDELVCKMASDPNKLGISLAASTFLDMLKMVENERDMRKSLLEWGVTESEREAFELLPDDERQCDYCKTTCFLSAVTCSCDSSKLVCITHKEKLCSCLPSKHCLRYRYTLDEFPVMLHRLKVRAESFDYWAVNVQKALEGPEDEKLDIAELKELIQEAETNGFPKTEILDALEDVIEDADKCSSFAQQLLSRKVRTRNWQTVGSKSMPQITVEELKIFYEQMCKLPCEIKERVLIKDMVEQVAQFEKEAKLLLDHELPDVKKLEKVLDNGLTLGVDLPHLLQLKHKLLQSHWLEDMKSSLSNPKKVTLETLRKLIDSGVNLPPHSSVEKAMAHLQDLLTNGEHLEERAKGYLQAKFQKEVQILEDLVNEAHPIPVFLPNVLALRDVIKKAKGWSTKGLQNANDCQSAEEFENLTAQSPVHSEQLGLFLERARQIFLKKNSKYTLLEVLLPRKDLGFYFHKNNKSKSKDGNDDSVDEPVVSDNMDHTENLSSATLRLAEQNEIEAIREVRNKNINKRAENTSETCYCICHKPLTKSMLQCELCKDWFHVSCVSLHHVKEFTPAAALDVVKSVKFLCPLCHRSRRPRLEMVCSLVASVLKLLPVRIPEGEALHRLKERVTSWQKRARSILATKEVTTAIIKLSKVKQDIHEDIEKDIKSGVMLDANNSGLTSFHNSIEQSVDVIEQMNLKTEVEVEENIQSMPAAIVVSPTTENSALLTKQENKIVDTEDADAAGSDQLSKTVQQTAALLNTFQDEQSSLESPIFELPEWIKHQLEELMMEGDLLEVTIDETYDIWRILQASKPSDDSMSKVSFLKDEVKENLVTAKLQHLNTPSDEIYHFKSKKIKVYEGVKSLVSGSESESKSFHCKNNSDFKSSRQVSSFMKKTFQVMTEISKGKELESNLEPMNTEQVVLSEEEEDSCAAIECLRPTGDAVNWVQCDGGCEEWFHLHCMGLELKDVSETEDYICPGCMSKSEFSSSPVDCLQEKENTLDAVPNIVKLVDLLM
ncbi:lysine-specific demethylase 5A-like isoform X2 [Tachypleus tridentatus]|uniref:lysine-specific demethylase 5A-like isoform X2 n=1 Tax=Tachypleus tridentatus TaxID=6853 RepID=UPI003FD1C2D4